LENGQESPGSITAITVSATESPMFFWKDSQSHPLITQK
jgi:hypothetical protein